MCSSDLATSVTVNFTQDGTNNPLTAVNWYYREAGSWVRVFGTNYSVSSLTPTSTSSTLTISNLSATTDFRAEGFTGCSVGTTPDFSSEVTVTVKGVVSYTGSTLDGTTQCEGESFGGFEVDPAHITNSSNVTYQWQKKVGSGDFTDIDGATLSTLRIGTGTGSSRALQPTDSGFYRCVLRNDC